MTTGTTSSFTVLIERRSAPRWLATPRTAAAFAFGGAWSPGAHAQTASGKTARDPQQVIDAPSTPTLNWAKDFGGGRSIAPGRMTARPASALGCATGVKAGVGAPASLDPGSASMANHEMPACNDQVDRTDMFGHGRPVASVAASPTRPIPATRACPSSHQFQTASPPGRCGWREPA